MSLNKCMLVGRLGKDVVLKTLESGSVVANMSIATDESYKKDGVLHKKTEWHQVVLWGKQAENAAKFLSKGREVLIEGRLQTRTFTDTKGLKHSVTEIVAQQLIYLGNNNQKVSNTIPNEVLGTPMQVQEEDPTYSQDALEVFREVS